MMHSRIENEDIVERYVRHQLPPADEEAFDEHLLGCDECFGKVQAAERFQAGMRDAAARGLLDDNGREATNPGSWFPWALALTTCTAVIATGIAAWLYFGELQRLRSELAGNAAVRNLEPQPPAPVPPPTTSERTEANVALVILQASRTGEQQPRVTLSPASNRLVLWIDIGPSRYRQFRIELATPDNRPILAIDALERNAYGALVASVPSAPLPAGSLRATLTGQEPPPASLIGEYRFGIDRQ